jgi:sialic acid synthase SpsE
VPAFKIASGDLTFAPLLQAVVRTGKPILLSTGMATIEEIGAALAVIRDTAALDQAGIASRVVLLHCVACYPTPPHDANLSAISRLQQEFGLPVGYSDHTLGVLACFGAVALGACVIEKHFTLQKEGRSFRDHQLSADPTDMAELVTGVATLALMRGTKEGNAARADAASRQSMRRSLAARVPIRAGQEITLDHITCLRPGTGLPPSMLSSVVGRVALADVPAGQLIPASAVGLPA